jgi:hypothetical protein
MVGRRGAGVLSDDDPRPLGPGGQAEQAGELGHSRARRTWPPAGRRRGLPNPASDLAAQPTTRKSWNLSKCLFLRVTKSSGVV